MRFIKVLSVIFITILIIGIASFYKKESTKENISATTPVPRELNTPIPKIQECPDAWYMVGTPVVVENPDNAKYAGQYFMINNARRELTDYDVEWIEQNCPVNKPELIE